jgi:hypothetical protein
VDAYACVQEEEEVECACAKKEDGSAYSNYEEEHNAYARIVEEDAYACVW